MSNESSLDKNFFKKNTTLSFCDRKYYFPELMGIINVTPDSFSDGGSAFAKADAVKRAKELASKGATILDVGGESSRPGAEAVSMEEEIRRTIPVIEEIHSELGATFRISIDTTKYEVAKRALQVGASMINDISGLQSEPRFMELAAEYNAELVIMHMQGTPRTMQKNPIYENVVEEVLEFLLTKVQLARNSGVEKIYIDPGIGFGKTLRHNMELLANLHKFTATEVPVLLGISRKSFMPKLLAETIHSTSMEVAQNRDTLTHLIHSVLLHLPISIIRVHNTNHIHQLKMFAEYAARLS